jgi:hypothetical protein
MASTTTVPVDESHVKPSFAKVAASAYKPQNNKETPSITNSQAMAAPSSQTHDCDHTPPVEDAAQTEPTEHTTESLPKENAGSTATRTGQWANNTGHQVVFESGSKEDEPDKLHPSIQLVKSLATEDNATQVSSSDGSAKPPSIDGKSVASATTFALDEKESIRPDDSASLRAVEEEDVASPPDSIAAGSRVGSDSGAARAFRDQLNEISVMGPSPLRGAPPGRFPNSNANNSHSLYDPNQSPDAVRSSMSQPPVNGMPSAIGPHSLPPPGPDGKLLEALESPRDRLFVLKIEQDFIDFIKDSNETEFSLPNCNTFYRMLAHRLADYYLLGHVVDNTMTGVKIIRTPYCRVPPPLSGLPIMAKSANTPPVDAPARKIMRRGDDGKSGTNTTANSANPSKTTSEAGGGSGSETGNEGGHDSENKDKSALTREEREARYREARLRIFGNADTLESESPDPAASGEDKDISRSSSASGKKKNKKQRNYDDDGFEARSRYNVYYPQQYAVPSYNADANAIYYGGYPAPAQNTHYPGMAPNVSPPPSFTPGYPMMMPQEQQAQFGWPGPQYQPPNATMGYPAYGTVQNGYDLSADFNRSMQSFQSAGMPTQITPKMTNPPMATYHEPYQPQNMPMNPAWSQIGPQPSYSVNQPSYAQNGSTNRPMSAPIQPVGTPYAFGQFPSPNFNTGKPNRNQHPLPGSFNRQQFNPQSQAFIPGGRNGSFPVQPSMAPVPPQGMNSYGNMPISIPGQLPTPMHRQNPPISHPQPFGSPRGIQNTNPLPVKVNNPHPSQATQQAPSQTVTGSPGTSQSHASSVPPQSSIAKWGTPSHLPPKPPPPAQPQPSKFGLPNPNFPSAPRLPNGVPPTYPNNGPMIRGGGLSAAPNIKH